MLIKHWNIQILSGYLVSQRSPLVQLLELLAVFALTSSFTMLCSCSYFVGSDAYFVSSLCTRTARMCRHKLSKQMKLSLAWLDVSSYQTDAYGTSNVEWISLTLMLPPMSVLTIDMADPNFSAMIHESECNCCNQLTTSKHYQLGRYSENVLPECKASLMFT